LFFAAFTDEVGDRLALGVESGDGQLNPRKVGVSSCAAQTPLASKKWTGTRLGVLNRMIASRRGAVSWFCVVGILGNRLPVLGVWH